MYPSPIFEPVHCSMSSSKCCFLTCIPQAAGKVIWYSHLFNKFLHFVVIHTVKALVNQWSRVDIFGIPLFFLYQIDVGNLISCSFAFSKYSLYIWKFLANILLKPHLKDFEHYLASMWNEHNCMIVWTFSGIALLWDRNKKWLFPVLWPLLNF